MRLTNIAQLRLPFGRLHGYATRLEVTDKELPVSIDQGRHVAAGERPGSWMAISFRLDGKRDLDDLAHAWQAVVERHGTLRTVFRPGPKLHEARVAKGLWVEHRIAPGQAVNIALREVLDTWCTPHAAPAHRLCVLQTAEASWVVIAADHSHLDMWSLLVIMRDFLTGLSGGFDPGVEVPAFANHTVALLNRPPAPAEVVDRWRNIIKACGDVMPRFPLPLDDSPAERPHPERVEVRDIIDPGGVAALGEFAQSEEVSTLSLVVSTMTRITRELADAPLRAVFPVHSRYEERWHDSVGWFITNSVIDSPDPDPKACASAVAEAIRLGSWPLAGILAPWGGMPQAPGMFAISWLDLRRLPVKVDSTGLDASFVGATIETDGVMVWFVLDWSGLHLRCRYPDTDLARANVGLWLDRLVEELRRISIVGVH